MTKDTKNKQLIFLHLFEENIWRLFTRNKYDYLWDSATQNIQRKQTAEMHIGTAETWICIQYHWQKRTWFGPVVTQVSICRSLFIHFCTKSDFFFFPQYTKKPSYLQENCNELEFTYRETEMAHKVHTYFCLSVQIAFISVLKLYFREWK